MTQDMPGAGAAVGGTTTLVIPGEMAARVGKRQRRRTLEELAR